MAYRSVALSLCEEKSRNHNDVMPLNDTEVLRDTENNGSHMVCDTTVM